MKKNLLALFLVGAFVVPVTADKPEWAGKGKPTVEQKAAHKPSIKEKENLHEVDGIKNQKNQKDKVNKLKGLEKQKSKKSEQVQKELDKGSDKAKESRETSSKKWWNFWGE